MIITSPNYLYSYNFHLLPNSFTEAVTRHAKKPGFVTVLRLFESYCHVTRTRFEYTSLSSKRFEETLQGFVGAIHSGNFVAGKIVSKRNWTKCFINALDSLRSEVPGMPDPKKAAEDLEHCKAVWLEQSGIQHEHLDQQAVRYWNSWPLVSKKGKTIYLALSELWHSHGVKFTDEIYNGWKKRASKQADVATTEFHRFFAFLAKNKETWPSEAFQSPAKIKRLFATYMAEYLEQGEKEGRKVLEYLFNNFIEQVNDIYIKTGVWAQPFTPFIKFNLKDCIAPKKEKKGSDGVNYHDQLLTQIPLNLTDSEAIDIIFKKVKSDIEVVSRWATAEATDLYARVENRVALAKTGTIRALSNTKMLLNTPRTLADHCATFEHFSLPPDSSSFPKFYGYEAKKVDLAYQLGIPTYDSLLPYQCLLVIEHPQITPYFLYNFELYNSTGQQSGFLPTDTGFELIGYKDRRTPEHSEMKIQLTSRSARWVQEIIKITEPLRKALREKGDDTWRMLFLTCGASFFNPGRVSSRPYCLSNLQNHPITRKRVTAKFEAFTPLRGDALLEFITRITPSRVRASCGVAVYLETRDVKKMSEALGHIRYSRNVLEHYLPSPILAFFQSRWIRIFQRGMICLAMQDSPYLLQATDFLSMEELHEFLRKHAISEIPAYLKDPEGINNSISPTSDEASKIYVSIGTGVLTALLSLQAAVNDAKDPGAVSGKARYWAEFAQAVTAEVERDNDGLLHEHLKHARLHCDSSRMEKLIYDAA